MFYLIKTQGGEVIGRLELASDLLVEPEQKAPATPPPPPKKQYRRVMLPAAGDFSYEDYIAMNWTDQDLVSNGYMAIEEVAAPAAGQSSDLHPSVANTQMGAEWQPEPAPTTAVPPPPPAEQSAPAVPPPPAPEQSGPAVPPPPPQSGPAVPPPPAQEQSGPAVPPPPSGAATGDVVVPEGCELVDFQPPVVPGREFMIRGVSYERLRDKAKVFFDARIHGESAEHIPAVKKDGTFKKKRGITNEFYDQVLAAHRAAEAPQQGAAVPPPPQETGPAVPPPPPGGGMIPPPPGHTPPVTAPPPPANLQSLEGALKEWGEEM